MKKKEILEHKLKIKAYFLFIQRTSIAILYLSLMGYAASLLLLLDEHLILAVIVASAAFLIARLLRSNVVKFARWQLKRQGRYEDMFVFLDKERKGREEMAFLELLRKAIDAVE